MKKLWILILFISITASIQQVYNIAKELGELDPANKEFYLKNARDYAKKLRKLKDRCLKWSKKILEILILGLQHYMEDMTTYYLNLE